MLRRTVWCLHVVRPLPSPSCAFSINLKAVFDVHEVERADSVNEFIELHTHEFTPLKNDIKLTDWERLSPCEIQERMRASFPSQTKEAVDGAVASQFSMLTYDHRLEKAIAASELRDLGSKGFATLYDFRARRGEIQFESKVVKFLDEYVQKIDELFAWLDKEVQDFKERHPEWNGGYSQHLCRGMTVLTHYHPYDGEEHEQPTVMLGRECNSEVNKLLERAFPDEGAAEHCPIQYVIGPWRHGKSLILAQVVALAAKHRSDEGRNFSAVGITFNNPTDLMYTYIDHVDQARSEFWGRVVHSWYYAMRKNVTDNTCMMEFCDLRRKPFFSVLSFEVARALAESLGLGRVVIAVDKVSKLTDRIQVWRDVREKETAIATITAMYTSGWSLLGSGLSHAQFETMKALTARKIIKVIPLKPLTIATRSDFQLMKKYVRSKYTTFTPTLRALFEVLKNVPGYMGTWVRMLDKQEAVHDIDDLYLSCIDFTVKPALVANPSLFTDYWRAMANGTKGSDVSDASPMMKGLEALGVIVALPGINNKSEPVTHRYLSPVAIAHRSLKSASEYNIISSAIMAMAWAVETAHQGMGVEHIVEASLVLHAAYVNDPLSKTTAVSLGALIQRLCGELHICVSDRGSERLPVRFSKNALNSSSVKEVDAFPSVPCNAPPEEPKHDARFQKTIEALESPDVAVLRPKTLSNSMGCDRTMVCRIGSTGDDVALLIFDTVTSAQVAAIGGVEKRVIDTLRSVLEYVKNFNARCSLIKISRVCFVHCNPAVRPDDVAVEVNPSVDGNTTVEQDEKTLKLKQNPFNVAGKVNKKMFIHTKGKKAKLYTITQELAAEGCTTSLHTVWTEEEWRNLLDCLYFVMPEIGEKPISNHAANHSKK
ncbi:Hypothetical protein, putative [Bodo saltans]|uniref:Uncharacterized protein n=1 Tax=Bodo saltans TaxID=75058 RepID=A0A0S4JR00_BODSA|nr:Hypothetical protein, putative [Bodo saltans]|eukprot:CUG92976.1 Hypothetical protein, putative [Bodo saltans]